MINENYLKFEVLTKPDKDLFKTIQSNAKFKSLSDVIRTKVGINNFYNFSIAIKSTIVLRDIILNSQFVSGWARSSQVLNKTDSAYASYKFLTRDTVKTQLWIDMMEDLQNKGHSQDNMRSLIYLDSINDYAISIDILHLLYLCLVVNDIEKNVTNSDLKDELKYFSIKIDALLKEYDVNYLDFENMLTFALSDFPAINCSRVITPTDITGEYTYIVNATYSVVGQIWRHRTLVKQYDADTYDELVSNAIVETSRYDYDSIGMHKDISELIKEMTKSSKTVYDLCQGSIVPLSFSGTIGAVHKALSQRTCFINDSPQFKDAFNDFKRMNPNLKLLPPCKLNTSSTNSCYVGYVNESRIKGEEFTQVPCPIYLKSKGYDKVFEKSIKEKKTQWYIDNLELWKNVCK